MEIKEPYRPGYCPHCSAKLANNRTDLYLYGSPIRICEKCHGQYLNRCYHEAAIDGYSEADISVAAGNKKIGNALLLLVLAVGVNALFYFMGRHTWVYLLFLGLGVVYLISAVAESIKVRSGSNKAQLDKAMEESLARLQDPQYAKKLQKLGYAVPAEYLPEEEREETEE